MMLHDVFQLSVIATLVDFVGSLLIGLSAGRTLFRYLLSGHSARVVSGLQYRLAADLVTALSFKSGAGIIRTLTVTDWSHFALLLAIISLRFFLGQIFSRLYKTNP
ncbi:DUF1622 domain-containing protein [Spirosoma oryzicola]|uniref:DUF1622 domain-containing protein n=1 Tax=Spirosoma oryzicola TaxID=2898794 RepID=UPI001E46BE45|nr:DUF1622 domain-containing protein [Spirosoma oryzicola]UHG93086.1 DUF1622 domain-containing protein [Spirosoma oryzicola]